MWRYGTIVMIEARMKKEWKVKETDDTLTKQATWVKVLQIPFNLETNEKRSAAAAYYSSRFSSSVKILAGQELKKLITNLFFHPHAILAYVFLSGL
jgi:hypothetical protein